MTKDQEFGVAAVRALQEWLGTMPDAVPDRAAEALWETAQNSIEAIAEANGIADAMDDVAEEHDEMDDSSDEYWALVVTKLG